MSIYLLYRSHIRPPPLTPLKQTLRTRCDKVELSKNTRNLFFGEVGQQIFAAMSDEKCKTKVRILKSEFWKVKNDAVSGEKQNPVGGNTHW